MTPERLREIVLTDPPATALLFDFDGTLSPIVDDPARAEPVAGVADLLVRLAARFGRVAVVSGRPRSFLTGWLPLAIDLSCLYGLELRLDGVESDHPDAEPWRPRIADVAAAADLPAGVTVEAKGLSLTVHYRRAPEAESSVVAWASTVAAETGLELRRAKASVELHPPVRVDKGTSVHALAAGCGTVVYVGDDVGDLPAFAALDELRGAGVRTIKVASGGDELPDDVARAADLVVHGPDAVMAIFAPLVTR